MLFGSRFRHLELVEHGLPGDLQGDLLQVGVGLDPRQRSRDRRDERLVQSMIDGALTPYQ
jgi:hypothetical protein